MKTGLIANRLTWGVIRLLTAFTLAVSWVATQKPQPAAAGTITFLKSVQDGMEPTGVANRYEIVYNILVTNNGSGNADYALSDTPMFGSGMSIVSACYYKDSGTTCTALPGTTGPWTLQTLVTLGGNNEAYFQLHFVFDWSGGGTAPEWDCTVGNGETTSGFTGLRNSTTLSGDFSGTQYACEPVTPPATLGLAVHTHQFFTTGDNTNSCGASGVARTLYYQAHVLNLTGSTINNLTISIGGFATSYPGGAGSYINSF